MGEGSQDIEICSVASTRSGRGSFFQNLCQYKVWHYFVAQYDLTEDLFLVTCVVVVSQALLRQHCRTHFTGDQESVEAFPT